MSKLYIMRGLPASGKTTKAKELMLKNLGLFRINRDEIRKMAYEGKWSFKKELKVMLAQEATVRRLLSMNIDVLIDDTNLTTKSFNKWVDIAIEYGVTIDTQNIETDVEECVKRDKDRENSVGSHVIWSMALKNKKWKPKKGIILCDIDGTLADIRLRKYCVDGEHKDWKAFFEGIHTDAFRQEVWEDVKEVINDTGYDLFLVSGRNEKYRKETETWFGTHNAEVLQYAKAMFMRREDDRRPDTDVKQNFLDMIGKEHVRMVFDDRPSVIRMWESNGISVVDCGDGVEF